MGNFAVDCKFLTRPVPETKPGTWRKRRWPVPAGSFVIVLPQELSSAPVKKRFRTKDTTAALEGPKSACPMRRSGNGRRGCACARLAGLPDLPTLVRPDPSADRARVNRSRRVAPARPWRGERATNFCWTGGTRSGNGPANPRVQGHGHPPECLPLRRPARLLSWLRAAPDLAAIRREGTL